jgi:hypothetical protein
MKSVLAALAFIISFAAVAQQDNDRALASFELFVLRAMAATDKSTEVYQTRNLTWARRYVKVSGLKYDVRRSDSLVAPIAAYVTFTHATHLSPRFDSKAEAEATRDVDTKLPAMLVEVSLNYGYRDGKWHFVSGTSKMWIAGSSREPTPHGYPRSSRFPAALGLASVTP